VQFPNALLHNAIMSIGQAFPSSRCSRTPSPTRRSSTIRGRRQTDVYDDSRAEGTKATVEAMTDMTNKCPLTSYVLIGFSQGAVILATSPAK